MSFAGDLRAVVRHRDFRRLLATRLTSQAADGVFQAALASLFFFSPEKQTSAGSVAAAFATLLLPYSLVGPFAGVLLDRWRRRQVLVYANLLRAAHGARRRRAARAADVTGWPALRRRARVPVGQPVLPRRAVGRAAARRRPATSWSWPTRCRPTSRHARRDRRRRHRLRPQAAVRRRRRRRRRRSSWSRRSATPSPACSRARMDRDLLGPDLDDEPPQTREAVRRVARGLVDGARHVWHAPRRRAARWRRSARTASSTASRPSRRSCCSAATSTTRTTSTPASPGWPWRSPRPAPASSSRRWSRLRSPSACASTTWITVCFALRRGCSRPSFVVALSEWLLLVGAFVLGVAAQGSKICVDTIVQDVGRRRLPGPGLLVLRRAVQRRLRRRPRPSARWPCPPTATPARSSPSSPSATPSPRGRLRPRPRQRRRPPHRVTAGARIASTWTRTRLRSRARRANRRAADAARGRLRRPRGGSAAADSGCVGPPARAARPRRPRGAAGPCSSRSSCRCCLRPADHRARAARRGSP